ncbi:MAG: pilus assembly protein [Amphritea sp.]|nr:pilus assembly protein [Amphritea sp.]
MKIPPNGTGCSVTASGKPIPTGPACADRLPDVSLANLHKSNLNKRHFHKNCGRHPVRDRDRSSGVTTVEFAIVGSLFFLLMFSVIDFALLGFANLTMQNAVREGARYAITGQTNLDPDNTGDRKKAIVQRIKNSTMGYFDQILEESDIVITDSNGTVLSGFGAPGQYVVITMNCSWPVLSPFTQVLIADDEYRFSVSAAMRNEEFPGGGP